MRRDTLDHDVNTEDTVGLDPEICMQHRHHHQNLYHQHLFIRTPAPPPPRLPPFLLPIIIFIIKSSSVTTTTIIFTTTTAGQRILQATVKESVQSASILNVATWTIPNL